jgi:hypothetical protein
MHTLFEFILFVLLITIAIQDFKYRAIIWIIFPALFISCIVLGLIDYKSTLLQAVLSNVCFLLVQLLLLSVYFFLKNKKIINIINLHIGLGISYF